MPGAEASHRVIVADDHPLYRKGLRELLRVRFDVVDEAADGREAVAKVLELQPDVAILDIRMPVLDGLEAARQIHEQAGNVGILVISATDSDSAVFGAFAAGARGFVAKDELAENIFTAVGEVARGGAYLPPSISARAMQGVLALAQRQAQPHGRSRGALLTLREQQILEVVAGGMRNQQIGQMLGISTRTVGNHLTNIYRKLHVSDRTQAIVAAMKQDLLKPKQR